MTRQLALLLLGSFLVASTTNAFSDNKGQGGKPLYEDAELVIPDSELPELESQALNGSGKAAHHLAMFFGVVRNDSKAQLYWERIAAENGGDPLFMYNYAVLLNGLPDVDSNERRRIRFWMKKAADAGYGPAKEALANIKE